jgi:acyl carrier protein
MKTPAQLVSAAQSASGQTSTEQALAALWQDILQVERVRCEDSFLELGGDSLYAVELASRVQEELSVEISLAEIFSATLAGLAARVDELRLKAGDAPREEVRL